MTMMVTIVMTMLNTFQLLEYQLREIWSAASSQKSPSVFNSMEEDGDDSDGDESKSGQVILCTFLLGFIILLY